mgnify:CR=1 FL=1
MDKVMVRSIAPYLIGLLISLGLWIYSGTIDYTARPGELGPAVWPRLAILLMGASCLFEITRRLLVKNEDATGFLEAFEKEEEKEAPEPVHLRMLIGGIILMGIYAVALPFLGFIFGTFLFLAAFMYIGGYRSHAVIWGMSVFVTLACGILFLRVAYVSLPRGVEPFAYANDIFFMIPRMW